MRKKEIEYLRGQIKHNKTVIELVKQNSLWSQIYTTPELKEAFIQGIMYVNDVFDKFIPDAKEEKS